MSISSSKTIMICLMLGALKAKGQQQAIAPIPPAISAILQQAGIPQPPPELDPSSIASVVRPESPFQYQPFVLMPHFVYRFLYEYGVLVGPNHPATTLIDTFSPGLALQIGSNWTIDYTATWDVYSNHQFKDTLGHSVAVIGKQTFSDWTVELTQSYLYSSQPLVETGVQTTVQEYKTALDVSRSFGEHVEEETIANQDLRYAVTFTDSYEWSVDEWLHYRFASQFDAALGGGAGYVHESQGSDSNFYKPEAQLSWQPTEKIEIKASGGFEHRIFLDYPRTSLNTPTYDLSVEYSPVQTTKLILDFDREITPSYFADQSDRIAKMNLSLSQRLLGRYFLTGGVGYNDVSYITTGQANSVSRNDAQTTVNLRLSTAVFGRGTVSLLCFRTRNSSSIAGYGFVTTQFGVELGYRF